MSQIETPTSQPTQSVNEAFFRKQMRILQKNLGKQCAIQNDDEFLRFQQLKSQDLTVISDEQFSQQIAFFKTRITDYDGLYKPEWLNSKELCYMSRIEIVALMMYSMDVYRALNRALRANDEAYLSQVQVYLKVLNSALDKIKNYVGYVKRGTQTNLENFADHKLGSVVTYFPYTSTSVGRGFGGNVRSLIFSKTCKYISPFAVAPEEEEVLCKLGTRFKVLHRKDGPKSIHFILEEEL